MPIAERLQRERQGRSAGSRIWGCETTRRRVNVGYQLTERWSVSTGVRND